MGLRKRRVNYTLNELDYIKENYLMMTDKEMALALHRTNFSISSKRKK